MSVTSRDFQFQLLLLRGTFSIPYIRLIDITYRTASYAASNTSDAVFDEISATAFGAAYKAAYNAAEKQESLGDKTLVAFREVLKMDGKIQEDIKSEPLWMIPIRCIGQKREEELVQSLINVDTNVTDILDVYYMVLYTSNAQI